MVILKFATLAGFAFAIVCGTASAAEKVDPGDRALLAACLTETAKNLRVDPTIDEVPGVPGRLATAGRDARGRADSCINVIFNQCQHAGKDYSTAGMSSCFTREQAAWDERLNIAYHKVVAQSEDDAVANLKKVQQIWIGWRDATCTEPSLIFKGTMAVTMAGACMVELTARQTIWMENLLN